MDQKLKDDLIAYHKEEIDLDGIECVYNGDWVAEHKHEYKETVYKYQDKYYSVDDIRSGSYFTDYDYDDPEVYEVVPKEVIKTVWVAV
jgi:hypothetical protein